MALIEDAIVRALDAKDNLERELPLLQYQAKYDGHPVCKHCGIVSTAIKESK